MARHRITTLPTLQSHTHLGKVCLYVFLGTIYGKLQAVWRQRHCTPYNFRYVPNIGPTINWVRLLGEIAENEH